MLVEAILAGTSEGQNPVAADRPLTTQPVAAASPGQLPIGVTGGSATVRSNRYYTLCCHLLYWVHEQAAPLTETERVAERRLLSNDCPQDAPISQIAADLLPFYQNLADTDIDPSLYLCYVNRINIV